MSLKGDRKGRPGLVLFFGKQHFPEVSGGLQVDYFISHHWAEDFGEFVQSVLPPGGDCTGKGGARLVRALAGQTPI